MDVDLSELLEILEDRGVWCAAVQGSAGLVQDLVTEQLFHWNRGFSMGTG